MRPVTGFHIQIGGRKQLGEVLIAHFILHQERHMRRLLARAGLQRTARREFHGQQRAHDGLDACLGQGLGDFIDTEQVVGVGDRRGRCAGLPRQIRQLLGADRALQKRIGAFHAQVDERRHGVVLQRKPVGSIARRPAIWTPNGALSTAIRCWNPERHGRRW